MVAPLAPLASRKAYEACTDVRALVSALAHAGLDSRTLRLLAVDLAAAVLPLVQSCEDRPQCCVETAYRYLEGEVSLEELDTAREAADAAIWGTSTARAAAWAADSAAWAAAAAAAADWAARAAVLAATRAAAGTEINLAAVVRRRVPWETVDELVRKLEAS